MLAPLLVLLVAWAALVATHHAAAPAPVSRAAALADLRRDPATAGILRRIRFTVVQVSAIDRQHEAVWLLDGSRLELTAVVTPRGSVPYSAVPARNRYAYGSNIANDWRVLALMTLVFVLMTAVWPLRRVRNLDVLVAAGTVASVFLLNAGLIERMVVVSYTAMLYLAARCAWRAFAAAPARCSRSEPLFDRLTARWSDLQRARMLRLVALACALIVVMVGISSKGLVDVGYAVMEGATLITHGVLPYGHIPDVLHGDTYPIGSYLFYVPFAALSPVSSEWSDADFALVVAVLAALLASFGVWRAFAPRSRGWSLRRSRRRPAEPAQQATALRGVIAFLAFPPLLVTISTGTTDVVVCAILLAAILLWRRPAIAASVLAAGAWFKLAPAALIPILLAGRSRRSLARALTGCALVSVAMLALLVGVGGLGAISAMVRAIGYQQSRDSLDSLWAFTGSVPLQQLAQAATLAIIAGGALRMHRDPSLRHDRARTAALAGAVMLGLELSASYWTYLYLAWALPFLALSVLAPDAG